MPQRKGKVERTDFHCEPCDRYFTTRISLEDHWLDSKWHYWCLRCDRFFKFEDALESHYENSRSHWICDDHDVDFLTSEDLTNHYITEEDHHYCKTCNQLFSGAASLRSHSLTHLPKDIQCWGCEKDFNKYSTLLAHLETEKCSVTRIRLDKLAVACTEHKHYVIPGQEEYLRCGGRKNHKAKADFKTGRCNRCDRYFPTTEGLISHVESSFHHPFAYQCAACKTPFADLSGLLTHIESVPCAEGISYGTGAIGKLLQHLWQKIAE